MNSTWVKTSAFALGGALLLCAASASQAASIPLTDGSGTSVGWTAMIPDNVASDVSLSFVRSEGGTYFFNESINFTKADDPIIVSFIRTSASAPQLAVATETVRNNTGVDWAGYRLFVSSGSDASGTPNYTLNGSIGTPGGFAIDPFTTFAFANNSQDLVLGGGVVAAGSTWTPGSATGSGLLVVNSGANSDHFSLKQIPIPIPLPAAAWTGLSSLVGLAVLKSVRRGRA